MVCYVTGNLLRCLKVYSRTPTPCTFNIHQNSFFPGSGYEQEQNYSKYETRILVNF